LLKKYLKNAYKISIKELLYKSDFDDCSIHLMRKNNIHEIAKKELIQLCVKIVIITLSSETFEKVARYNLDMTQMWLSM